MSIRYQGASVGILLTIVAAFVLLGFCLWGVGSLLRHEVQSQDGVLPASHKLKGRGG
jgi:hypothetical protein